MKKKIVSILLGIFLLTGCDVHYVATISENTFSEETTISTNTVEKETVNQIPLEEILDGFTFSNIPVFYNADSYNGEEESVKDGVEYYQINSFQEENWKKLQTYYDFSFYNFHRSQVIKECFSEINVQKTDSLYRLNTSDGCLAFQKYRLLNQITIELITDYDVLYHNADQVEGNHYFWNLDRDNADSKAISLTFNTEKEDLSDFDPTNVPEPEEENPVVSWMNQNQTLCIIIGFTVLFLFIIGIIFLEKKAHKKNS